MMSNAMLAVLEMTAVIRRVSSSLVLTAVMVRTKFTRVSYLSHSKQSVLSQL